MELRSAPRNGHLDVVRFLLESGACCHLTDEAGKTALGLASQHGFADIARFLSELEAASHRRRGEFSSILDHQRLRGEQQLLTLSHDPMLKEVMQTLLLSAVANSTTRRRTEKNREEQSHTHTHTTHTAPTEMFSPESLRSLRTCAESSQPSPVQIIIARLPLLQLYQLQVASRPLKWVCHGEIVRRQGRIQRAVLNIFQCAQERDPEKATELWYCMASIPEKAKTILGLSEVTHEYHPVETGNVLMQATRAVERLLRPEIVTQVVSGIYEEAPTGTVLAVPRFVEESVTTDTRAIFVEAVALPESMPGGDLLTQQQKLNLQLQECKSEQSGKNVRTPAVLNQLGNVTAQTGDLKQATEYLQESLRMKRSLHGHGGSPGMAVTLHALGHVTAQTGDLKNAMEYLQESLRMRRSLHGDDDHPGIAATLNQLGHVTAQTGDLKNAMEYLQGFLLMKRSLHGDGDHHGIAAILHKLGNVTAQTGDLKQATEYLQESLRMKRSLHGHGGSPGISAILHNLGHVTAQTGDLKQAMRYLEESLQMEPSLQGHGIAAILHTLGCVLAQTGGSAPYVVTLTILALQALCTRLATCWPRLETSSRP
eukprot:s57_g38.t2